MELLFQLKQVKRVIWVLVHTSRLYWANRPSTRSFGTWAWKMSYEVFQKKRIFQAQEFQCHSLFSWHTNTQRRAHNACTLVLSVLGFSRLWHIQRVMSKVTHSIHVGHTMRRHHVYTIQIGDTVRSQQPYIVQVGGAHCRPHVSHSLDRKSSECWREWRLYRTRTTQTF